MSDAGAQDITGVSVDPERDGFGAPAQNNLGGGTRGMVRVPPPAGGTAGSPLPADMRRKG